MNKLRKEIIALIDKLDKSIQPEGSAEHITSNHLKDLMVAIEQAENTQTLAAKFDNLEHFWASSVAWCSDLSKDIEKLIIMYREQP